jgi:hypothetical protein
MPSTWARAILFLSSYAPLFVILAVQGVHREVWAIIVASTLVLVAGLASVVLVYWIRKAATFAPFPSDVSRSSPRDDLAVAYIVTYILPFVGISLSSGRDVISLCLAFSITLLVAVRANLFYVNPLLNLLGYHIHEIEDSSGRQFALISRKAYVRPGTPIAVVALDRQSHVRLERL